jgi:hypothetical protein
MPTFTFITDFQGGTYICQKEATDLHAACFMWKDEIASGGYVQHLNTKAFSSAFDADIEELPPVAIDEVSNVWLFHLMLGDDMLNLHIVQTEMSAVPTAVNALEGVENR